MATVEKDINESSEKIDKVKRIVQDRALALEYKKQIPQTPIADGASWRNITGIQCSKGNTQSPVLSTRLVAGHQNNEGSRASSCRIRRIRM